MSSLPVSTLTGHTYICWHTLPFWDHSGGSSWPRGKRPVSRQERKARRWPPGGKWSGGRCIPSWLTKTSVPPQSAGTGGKKTLCKNVTEKKKKNQKKCHKDDYISDSMWKQHYTHGAGDSEYRRSAAEEQSARSPSRYCHGGGGLELTAVKTVFALLSVETVVFRLPLL